MWLKPVACGVLKNCASHISSTNECNKQMESVEHIDRFINGELSPEECRQFEQTILQDPAFAEEVAFYLNAKQAARSAMLEEKKSRFREIYDQQKISSRIRLPVKKLWQYAVAAAVTVGLIAGAWFYFSVPRLPAQLADEYIETHINKLSVLMTSHEDSLQKAKKLYNEGKFAAALEQLQMIIQADSTNTKAKELAGIVSLRLHNYDKALVYFKDLEGYTLFSNPGKFYHALTLLKRNQPGDVDAAKRLLQQVVTEDLAEQETAREWLKVF
jgi:tetratricopeptide (TPR) repeat protein